MDDVSDLLVDASFLRACDTTDHWLWLLPPHLQLKYMNLIGDLFLQDPDGKIYAFWLTSCEPEQIAPSLDAFVAELDNPDKRAEWLAEPLVMRLRSQGTLLNAGQCYGWKVPPWLGGSIDVTNIAVFTIGQLHGAFSELYRQVHDMPDGTKIVIKPVDK